MTEDYAVADALRKAVDKLDCALRMHHKWRADPGGIGSCKDGNDEWIVFDTPAEYGDSTVHELTVEALRFARSVRGTAAAMEPRRANATELMVHGLQWCGAGLVAGMLLGAVVTMIVVYLV